MTIEVILDFLNVVCKVSIICYCVYAIWSIRFDVEAIRTMTEGMINERKDKD